MLVKNKYSTKKIGRKLYPTWPHHNANVN